MRPFWRYYGGKWRAAPKYPPPLDGLPIVEPFAGAAGYATRHGAGRDVLLLDVSPVICSIWEWLIQATPDDVLAIPDIPEGGTVDDLDVPQAVKWLAGFWCSHGVPAPRKSPSGWAKFGAFLWGSQVRARIARQVPLIRNWRVVCSSYQEAPDVCGTWFVDPPYQTPAGRHYGKYDFQAHAELGRWCEARQGLVIACDQQGADWRPWNWSGPVRSSRGTSQEVAWVRGLPQLSLLETA